MILRVNGAIPMLAGAVTSPEPLAPTVGPVPARISCPITSRPPDYAGRWARAWQCDLERARRLRPPGMRDAVVAHWVLEAPWSSQVVHSYSLMLTHLRFMPDKGPIIRYLDDATHELALIAINPQADRALMLVAPAHPDEVWLQPPVFAAQLVAPSDQAAIQQMLRAVELVGEGRLSPHPTHARAWAEIFGDNMLRHAAAPVKQEDAGG